MSFDWPKASGKMKNMKFIPTRERIIFPRMIGLGERGTDKGELRNTKAGHGKDGVIFYHLLSSKNKITQFKREKNSGACT